MKRTYLRPWAIAAVVLFAIAIGTGGVFAARYESLDVGDFQVNGTAKIKTLELGGDPRNGTDGVTISGPWPTTSGIGATAGTGIAVQEQGDGVLHKTVLTLTDRTVALTDEAGVVAYGGTKLYDLPAGAILFLGATTDIDLTKSSAGVNTNWDGDVSLGTVTASNNNSLSSTEQNILPTTPTPQASGGATTANGQSTATENAVVDGTATAADVYLNLLVDDADHDVTGTACNLIANGTVTITWINLGDY